MPRLRRSAEPAVEAPPARARPLPGVVCPSCGREQLEAVGIGRESVVRCAAKFVLTRGAGFTNEARIGLAEQVSRSGGQGEVNGQEQAFEPCGWEQSVRGFLAAHGMGEEEEE
jgi:hypothetical protein